MLYKSLTVSSAIHYDKVTAKGCTRGYT